MDIHLSIWEILLRMTLSVIFGGLVGWERESRNKPAGLRTHMMVCLGSATFTMILLELYFAFLATRENPTLDPLRIIEAIVGGIGFLGAGSIIQSRGSVEGITTAAGVWVVGAIGLACGGGHYLIAGLSVTFTLLILYLIGIAERRFFKNANLDGN